MSPFCQFEAEFCAKKDNIGPKRTLPPRAHSSRPRHTQNSSARTNHRFAREQFCLHTQNSPARTNHRFAREQFCLALAAHKRLRLALAAHHQINRSCLVLSTTLFRSPTAPHRLAKINSIRSTGRVWCCQQRQQHRSRSFSRIS